MAATDLEIGGGVRRTGKGPVDVWYGPYASVASALAAVSNPDIREGKTVGIWVNNKIVEYCWGIDTSDAGLQPKGATVDESKFLIKTGSTQQNVAPIVNFQNSAFGRRFYVNNPYTNSPQNSILAELGWTDGFPNVRGQIIIYNFNRQTLAFYSVSITAPNLTANRHYNYPDKNGTIALTGDIDSAVAALQADIAAKFSKYKGEYPSSASLIAAHPTAEPGDWAIVDALGSDAEKWIWDVTDQQWVSSGPGSGIVQSVNGQVGPVVLAKGDIGLGNVDNTADADKPVSTATAQAIEQAKSDLAFAPIAANEAGTTHPAFSSAREAILWMLANGGGTTPPPSDSLTTNSGEAITMNNGEPIVLNGSSDNPGGGDVVPANALVTNSSEPLTMNDDSYLTTN